MRVTAIDPGNTMSAWCHCTDGVFIRGAKWPNEELLNRLRTQQDGWCAAGLLAIEMIASYGMPVGKEVFDTCLWIGRFMEAWKARGGEVRLVYRREVKLFHCHSARATDANIRAALIDRYGPGRELAIGTKRAPGPLYGIKGDEWSALAIALTVNAALDPKQAGGLFHVEPPRPAREKAPEDVPF